MKPAVNTFLIVILMMAFYFLARWPFYSQLLMGEEGIHARIFTERFSGPDFQVLARLNGKQFMGGCTNHPAMNYKAIAVMGGIFSRFLDLDVIDQKTLGTLVRFGFSLFQLIIWILFLIIYLLSSSKKQDPFFLVLFTVMMISPLAIGSSVMVQVDGSVGVLMCGLVAVSIFAWDRGNFSSKSRIAMVLISAAFCGFGKQEWSIILVIAALLALAWAVWNKKKKERTLPVTLIIGAMLGNAGSYLLYKCNYITGLSVFGSRAVSDNRMLDLPLTWWSIITNFPFILPVAVILLMIFILGIKDKTTSRILAFLFPAGLFFAFFLSSWSSSEYRYFAPALVVSTVSTAVVFPVKASRTLRMAIILMIILTIFQLAAFTSTARIKNQSVTLSYKVHIPSYYEHYDQKVRLAQKYTCLPCLPSGYAFYLQEGDYIINSTGEIFIRSFADRNSIPLCP